MIRRAAPDSSQIESFSRQTYLLDVGDAMPSEKVNGNTKPPRRTQNEWIAAAIAEVISDEFGRMEARLEAMEALLAEIRDRALVGNVEKEYYTTKEAATLLNKKPYTVREWCRLGRISAEKSHSGRGLDEEWRISSEELTRFQNEGLLPLRKFGDVKSPRRLK